MKRWASESGQRHRRERTGSYLIPLCQAPFGAHGMYSSSVPMLSIFFFLYLLYLRDIGHERYEVLQPILESRSLPEPGV